MVRIPCCVSTADGMLCRNTPIEDYSRRYGLWVKREDLACPTPGPPFSKTRGVYAHIAKRSEQLVGVLDTYHSQAGHAVARACQVLGKECLVFYPEFKHEPGYREPQLRALELGARLVGLPAGRSAILFHAARKETERRDGYMMPNALKLVESVEETARESPTDQRFDCVLIPASSGTIAAGVIRGMGLGPSYLVHLGYTRAHEEVLKYIRSRSGVPDADVTIIDEEYAYRDRARSGVSPPWPCNEWYDLKAFRWWIREGRRAYGRALLWNIG